MKATLFFILLASLAAGCTADGVSPAEDLFSFRIPSNFPPPVYTFENNKVTKPGFELGRALFYDPILSADSSISCANCHQQAVGFADPVHRFSKGVKDKSGFRNAPAIQNMAFQDHFFWDGGVKHLDFVPINAITSDLEMAEKLSHVVEKLQRSTVYPERFKEAFQSETITSQNLLFSLSQFMNLMVSSNSRYDKFIRHEGELLSSEELEGMKLFDVKCALCHSMDLFTDGSFRNNGLDETFERDSGRARVTEFSGDRGKFKVPSLRNVELTSPYMHDGRFKTLAQVLEHYAHAVKDSETLDAVLKQNNSVGITMTDAEKTRIIAFIKTLTDRDFTRDERFSSPFINN